MTKVTEFDEASGKFGPAMLALSERHRAFVTAALNQGTKTNWTRAARTAGYTGTASALRVTAHRLAHDERIQAALLEEAKRRVQAGTLAATAYLLSLVANKDAQDRDRLKAAGMILDRGGLHATTEHRVSVEHMSREEKIREVVRLTKERGEDPRKVLGNLIDITPDDFRVVDACEAECEEAKAPPFQCAVHGRER